MTTKDMAHEIVLVKRQIPYGIIAGTEEQLIVTRTSLFCSDSCATAGGFLPQEIETARRPVMSQTDGLFRAFLMACSCDACGISFRRILATRGEEVR